MKFKSFYYVLFALLLSSLLFISNANSIEKIIDQQGILYLSDKVVVGTHPGSNPLRTGDFDSQGFTTGYPSLDRLCRENGIIKIEKYYKPRLRPGNIKDVVDRMYLLTTDGNHDPWAVADAISVDNNLRYAEVYFVHKPCYEPNDPFLTNQWYIRNINSLEAWDIVRGEETEAVIIGIVDTGVYFQHPDLEPNMWINSAEDINGNGTYEPYDDTQGGDWNYEDDDDNGYVDDVVGYDVGANDPDPSEEWPDHGTHVAGCAAEATDNAIGGAGPAFSAKIMAAKAANVGGGLTATNAGIIYCVDNNAHFVNCSYGNYGYSQGEQDLVTAAFEDGTLIIAAAGNDNMSAIHYPAGYENVLSVAASANNNIRASFTNYGDWIDISSPGVSIYSTWDVDQYQSLQGTSMASPVCTGVAALIKAQDTTRTPADIWDIIKSSADSMALYTANPDWVGLLGSGRVDAYGAVAYFLMPNLKITEVGQTITNDDGDGILNPGEEVEVVLSLHNYWAGASNVHVSITGDNDLNIIDGESNFGNIGNREQADNSADPFVIEISADAGIRPAEVLAEITADNDYTAVDTFYLNISLMQLGFPLSMGENIEGAIGVLDVDYDNKDEIIFGTSDDNIYVCNEDGSILSGFPVSVGGDITGGIAVGQLDGPGALDMAICTRDGDIYFKTMNGANLPGFPVSAGGSYFSTPMILDMTPDFYHEAVFTSFGDGNIYAFKADGSLVAGFPYETSSRFYGSPAAGNLDGDDDLEIIAGTLDGQIHAINNDGSTLSGFPVQLDGAVWASPAIGDIDGDGSDEIIIGTQDSYLYALESDGSVISGFPVELSGQIKSDAALFDVDFDGAAEVFIGTNGEELYAIEGNGDIISGFPAMLGGTVSSSPLIADVDGDNQYEIILAVTDGVIYGFENDGTPMTNFPIPVNGTLTSSTPALTDLDADGDIEIIIGLRQNHENLLAFDIKHSSGLAGVDWKMFGHDMARQHRLHDYITSSPEDTYNTLPTDYTLNQNYPNPFNPATTIEYALPVDSEVELNVYNIMGQKVSTLVDDYQKAGYKSITWDASEYSSGIYFYRMIAGDKNMVRKMLLIK